MEKLISMTTFVIQQNMHYANKEITIEELQLRILNHAIFLQQPLTLGMFVPAKLVNGVWVVLEEPTDYDNWLTKNIHDPHWIISVECKGFQEAKERVLFEGFEYRNDKHYYKNGYVIDKNENIFYDLDSNNFIIEDSTHLNLVLTESAKKQIGL